MIVAINIINEDTMLVHLIWFTHVRPSVGNVQPVTHRVQSSKEESQSRRGV